MTTMLIANNCTRESGSFMGDQLCSLKAAYMFVLNEPSVDRVIMTMSPANEMNFLWDKFIRDHKVEVVWDNWNPGDWASRWCAWDQWRANRKIELNSGEVVNFHHYRELYLRIHGGSRQALICGTERGLGRRNIYEYWVAGQENFPDVFPGSDVYDVEIDHPPLRPEYDVYISPHCKTQGNYTFTFDYWDQVVHKLLDAGVTVTVGFDGHFCEDLNGHPLYKKHWGDHRQWMEQICRHRIIACGNTGTGWLAAACGVPLFTMEPPNSQMPDHRYRECGLRNIVEVMSEPDPDYCARRLVEEVKRTIVMTTGCYDILHAGHVRHLEKSRSLGSKLIVALNSDESVRRLKGPSRPINPQNQRKAVLEALRCVDEVRIFDGDTALPLIEEIRPTILTCGYGYTQDTIVGRKLVESWGGRAIVTYKDTAVNEPSTTKIVAKLVRASDLVQICNLGAGFSVNPLEKLKLLAHEFMAVRHLDGDVADCGVYRGGTSLILRRLDPDKHLHLFDTWTGNPFDDDLCHHKRGEWAASLEDCMFLVGTDSRTYYHPGVFPIDMPDYVKENKYCFVYVDMDTYQSTLDALNFFWPRLVEGGKIVVDDYGWEPCAGVKKAVDETFALSQCRVIQSNYTCVIEKQ